MDIPSELKYTKTHEWVLVQDDDVVVVGITDYAQDMLGDIVFVDLPEVDSHVSLGEECAVVESVKTAADVYAPVSGVIVEVNSTLTDAPALLNRSPYDDGWIFKIKVEQEDEFEELLTHESYEEFIQEEEE